MKSINQRIIKVFEELDIKQFEFAERIGVSQAYISKLFKDQSDKTPSDRLIRIISAEFNINEDWLRTGEGDMRLNTDTFSLDEYAEQKGLSQLEFDIIKAYIELDKDLRKSLMSNLKAIFNKHDTTEINHITSSNEPTIEELEEEYKKDTQKVSHKRKYLLRMVQAETRTR